MISSLSEDTLCQERVKNQNGKEFKLFKTNKTLENYYYTQQICNSDDDWQECLRAMREELPQSFRINSSRPLLMEKYKKLLSDFRTLETKSVDIKPISWSSNRSIWQIFKTRYYNVWKSIQLRLTYNYLANPPPFGVPESKPHLWASLDGLICLKDSDIII